MTDDSTEPTDAKSFTTTQSVYSAQLHDTLGGQPIATYPGLLPDENGEVVRRVRLIRSDANTGSTAADYQVFLGPDETGAAIYLYAGTVPYHAEPAGPGDHIITVH
ncbi:hypothetical protein [Schumannella soli]|uniref:Uncharacterized protein n=1 Tax=Schumannella soli TaxID=2590779 RepID=A0A506Y870_9MICO|nr:hypothetical protein [Schumannella soli]TPW78083.1 hypothetical protein FJ657_05505 [Schumannella soli]